jgi:hypothetical protein
MAPAQLTLVVTPPSLAEINVGIVESGAFEIFGCFSPRDTSTPLVSSEKVVPVVHAISNL